MPRGIAAIHATMSCSELEIVERLGFRLDYAAACRLAKWRRALRDLGHTNAAYEAQRRIFAAQVKKVTDRRVEREKRRAINGRIEAVRMWAARKKGRAA